MDGSALKEAREARGYSVDELGKILSSDLGKRIDGSKVSRMECGLDKIPADVEGFLALTSLTFQKPKSTKAISIAVSNLKGGIGKTSICVNLAYVLARAGAKVLLVDADSQGNSTIHVGIAEDVVRKIDRAHSTLYDVLKGEKSLLECIRETTTPNLCILPSYSRLAAADEELVGQLEVLKEKIEGAHDKFHFILFDCGPHLSTVTKNCLVATKYALIPVQTEPHSISGLDRMLTTLADMRRTSNRSLDILGIVPTMHSARVGQCKDSLIELHDKLGRKQTIYPAIPRSSVYSQSAAVNMITVAFDRGVPGIATFVEIASTLFERSVEK